MREVWESVLGCRGEMKRNAGKYWGKVWKSVLGCGVGVDVGGVGKCWGRCEKVCWGVGEVREDVGRSVGEGVRKCIGVWGK